MRTFVSSVIAVVVITLVFGFAFPAVMTGFAAVAFPTKAGGSLIEQNGTVVGSSLAAQGFTATTYFHERPSATSPAYNASYASNKYIFYPAASWSPTYVIDRNDPAGVGMWGLMVPPGGSFSWGGTAHMIPTKAKHKTTAFTLANWLVTKEGAIAQRQLLGYNMANAEAYNDPEILKFFDKNFGTQNLGAIFFGEAVKKLTPRPVSSYDVAIADVWNLVTEALNSDRNLDLKGALSMWESEFRNKAPEVK